MFMFLGWLTLNCQRNTKTLLVSVVKWVGWFFQLTENSCFCYQERPQLDDEDDLGIFSPFDLNSAPENRSLKSIKA